MSGIKMSDCKFYVYEEKRTVVCVIPNTSNMVLKFIQQHFRWNDIDIWWASGGLTDKLEMPNSFIGKAICSKDDEWDEQTGRLIAFSRAKDKCYKSFFKRANKLVHTYDQRLNDMITKFNDFGLKLEMNREALEKKIEENLGK